MIIRMTRIGLGAVLLIITLFALLPVTSGYAGMVIDEEPVGVGSATVKASSGTTSTTMSVGVGHMHNYANGSYLYPPVGDGYVLLSGWKSNFWIFAPKNTCFRVPEDANIPHKWANYKGEPCIP